ncbi:sulfate adenylyltransferase subunit CysN [Kaistia dalseonensis]|uniref:Multifunctional fusion protein n=1 Tax=Kaistia dalseonensis TaxID=410840 RepID=A0ABU0HEX3_9HYPH|nr:sulfate adenylyltransferase subunit CysN [Kaistia dalseonensis]MCX5497754.1 sulfate adenylyltransferase subunit CysN [Kaistia dalseonensis]MDQ0440398.1 bifunctional enzyme CysN/CysC [Kaistia dalseonensis]
MAEIVALRPHDDAARPVPVETDKGILRFLTCGSVDDGKSTLIGRLLLDTKKLFDDQLASLEKDSRRFGTVGDDMDLALLVDGLEAEREQGITIDVAYRFFATEKRKFIVADTPGHEQYTRNMATGASTADLAVLLIDARKGILNQTRRHATIAAMLGIRHVVLAINKIDLVDYDRVVYDRIVAAFDADASHYGFASRVAIPISARHGDNVGERSESMPWYRGPTLLEHLEGIDLSVDVTASRPFRFPVQWVNRPDLTFRGYAGTIAAGTIRAGDDIVVARTGQQATVSRIVTYDGDVRSASADEAVTLTLDREIDLSRGDILATPAARPDVSDQFAAHLIWMADEAMLPGRPYLMKIGTRTVGAAITELKHKVEIETLKPLAAKTLALNDIGFANLSLAEPIAFDSYEDNRTTGAFILIDRFTNATVAAGMIRFGLSRATNIHRQALDVDKAARAGAKGQKPAVLWFTGLSGSGKSTIANLVEKKLHLMGRHTYLLDGDNVRHGLNRDLGFTDADRVENIRRVAETAKLFVDAGLIVLVSFISPFRAERQLARDLVAEGEFVEIFVDTPLEVAEARDVKGLYKKAREGKIKNFTGIDSPYEAPLTPDIRLDTSIGDAEAQADRIVDYLIERGYSAA